MGKVYCYLLIAIFFMFRIVNGSDESLQCKDEEGNVVDWYVLYKIPIVGESSDPAIKKGTKYVYITSETKSKGWQPAYEKITSELSMPGQTLAPLYKSSDKSKALWISYSDQPPQKSAYGRFGHTKGVLMTDAKKGFWLIHSVPKFPPIAKSKYDYPVSGMRNGQSFLCISFKSDQMNTIGQQMLYNQIIPYDFNLPKDLSKLFPNLVKAAGREGIKDPEYKKKSVLLSTNGQRFTSFAKSDKWQKELYGDFVAREFGAHLHSQTWRLGASKLPSKCQRPRVYNVKTTKLDVVNVKWASTKDHSKWAVTTTNRGNNNWVCIGDINRASTQKSRGGGAVCINSAELWPSFRSAVNDYETCIKA